MHETPSGPPPAQCQARPRAARAGYRTDMLCASLANSTVTYKGADMPVCRMHKIMYDRWGETAEQQAALHWFWE